MSDTTKTEVRVMEGWVSKDAFADPCYAGCSFGKQMRPFLADQKATLVIGDKAVPMSKVEAMLREVLSAGAQVVVHANEMEQTMRAMDQGEFKYERDSYKKARRAWITIAAKYGIKLP